MCLPVSRLFWVSSLAYPNLLGTKGYVVVVVNFFYFSLFIYLLLLISLVRDASYTTQPLELLNSLGFQKSNNQQLLSREESNAHVNSYHGSQGEPSISNNGEHSHPEAGPQTSLENSEGIMI
jgi:hypothetical protein